ncbi:MAG: enoyl-CoA hydratase/isomerase family protein [Proteobacteria bacterium]|nr:enoyl-CoA hydratase/isomerase family protein [Pseudomonadota bacterium]
MSKNELLHKVQGGIGWITLNRPEALNALSLAMIRGLSQLLKDWERDESVRAVVIEGAGEKAFCAGGDVRAVYEAKQKGDTHIPDAFFREEYTLNTYIHTYPKPYISLIDGIAMGGGLGVSVNGSYRIVTERALLAMPETGIGFFPDVGATTFLNAAPGITGLYLALTGTRLKAVDALWAKLATHFIPSSSLSLFKNDLEQGSSLEKALVQHCTHPSEHGFLEDHTAQIEQHFQRSSLLNILNGLKTNPSPFAQNTYNTLMTKSPTSLAVVFRQLTQANSDFKERMKQEFRLSQRFIEGHDFGEGVRAVLIDKDHLPHWSPQTIEEVTSETIDHYFSSLSEKELIL